MNITTTTAGDDITQIVQRNREWHSGAGVAASALQAATESYLRSGLLEEHIKRDLRNALDMEMPRFDHRLTGEQLNAFHAFVDNQSDQVAAAAVRSVDAMLGELNDASREYAKHLTRHQ